MNKVTAVKANDDFSLDLSFNDGSVKRFDTRPYLDYGAFRELKDLNYLQRQTVVRRLERIYNLAHGTSQLARFIVFGSFVTDKPEPNDVDIFMLMEDTFDSAQLSGEEVIIFDNMAAQNSEGASVFWIRRLAAIGGEQAALEDWQIKRDRTRRGVVEVIIND